MKNAVLSHFEKQVIAYHNRCQTIRLTVIAVLIAAIAVCVTLHTAVLAVKRWENHTMTDSAVSGGQSELSAAIPADWIENPMAGVVYEPTQE